MDHLQRAAAERARSALDVLLAAGPTAANEFSLAKTIRQLAGDLNYDEYGHETGPVKIALDAASREFASIDRHPYPLSAKSVPWRLLANTRAMSSSAGSVGGYLAPVTTLPEAVDVLRPFSVTARMGVTVMDGLTGSAVNFGRTVTKGTATWQGAQGTPVSAADPALGSTSLVPRTVVGIITLSLQLLRQAASEAYVRRELLRTIGSAIDAAVLNGAGASEPNGILQHAGLQTQSGTSLGQSGLANMLEQCTTNNANDESVAFVTTPAVRELLQTRERATGSGIVWDRGSVVDKPAFVTTDIPAATMIAGDWSDVLLGIWGPGFQLDVDPSGTNFNTGQVSVRVMAHVDVAVLHPTSWCVATSIT